MSLRYLGALLLLAGCNVINPSTDLDAGKFRGPSSLPLGYISNSGATDGQAAIWNSSSGKWAPSNVSVNGATSSTLGTVKLNGDLTGDAAAPNVSSAQGSSGTFTVNAAAVSYQTSTGNGAFSKNLSVQTTNSTSNTSMTYAVPSNTVGNVTVITQGKVPSSATSASAVWAGFVTNNAGTCAIMAEGGTFAQQSNAITGTVASSPISVGLSSCNVVITVTGLASTTFNWSSIVQYAASGGS